MKESPQYEIKAEDLERQLLRDSSTLILLSFKVLPASQALAGNQGSAETSASVSPCTVSWAQLSVVTDFKGTA